MMMMNKVLHPDYQSVLVLSGIFIFYNMSLLNISFVEYKRSQRRCEEVSDVPADEN